MSEGNNTPYNERNKGVSMGPQDLEIRKLALSGQADALIPVLSSVAEDLESETAAHLETAWLKYETHQFFLQTKGDISAIHADVPDLGAAEDTDAALGKYEQSVTDYIKMFTDDWRNIVGSGLSPQEARTATLLKLVKATEEWRDRGVVQTPLADQLAVLADKPWDNAKLREVIAQNWAGGVTQGLWSLVSETGPEARTRLAEGDSVETVAEWYTTTTQELFDDALGAVDNTIAQTQPERKQKEV